MQTPSFCKAVCTNRLRKCVGVVAGVISPPAPGSQSTAAVVGCGVVVSPSSLSARCREGPSHVVFVYAAAQPVAGSDGVRAPVEGVSE